MKTEGSEELPPAIQDEAEEKEKPPSNANMEKAGIPLPTRRGCSMRVGAKQVDAVSGRGWAGIRGQDPRKSHCYSGAGAEASFDKVVNEHLDGIESGF